MHIVRLTVDGHDSVNLTCRGLHALEIIARGSEAAVAVVAHQRGVEKSNRGRS